MKENLNQGKSMEWQNHIQVLKENWVMHNNIDGNRYANGLIRVYNGEV